MPCLTLEAWDHQATPPTSEGENIFHSALSSKRQLCAICTAVTTLATFATPSVAQEADTADILETVAAAESHRQPLPLEAATLEDPVEGQSDPAANNATVSGVSDFDTDLGVFVSLAAEKSSIGTPVGFRVPQSRNHSADTSETKEVYASPNAAEPDFVVQKKNYGASISAVLSSPSTPGRILYELPRGTDLDIDASTGEALITAQDDRGETFPLAQLNSPWAFDAEGKTVPTWFEEESGHLVQVVEHDGGDFAYPIVADPDWSEIWEGIKKSGKKVWDGTKWVANKGKVLAKRVPAGFAVLCLAEGGWAWYRSDADGWVRVGDGVVGCLS